MPSRVERYSGLDEKKSRTEKNKEIYSDIKEMNFQSVVDVEPVVIRENFNFENFKDIYNDDNNDYAINIGNDYINSDSLVLDVEKEYDINKVILKAKENRVNDSYEEKRKLKKDEYNAINSVDFTKEESKTGIKEKDEEEIKELIDTIYSNTLAADINKENDLFSDLMASEGEDSTDAISQETIDVSREEISKKVSGEETILNIEINQAVSKMDKEKEKIDNSFFTKSLEFTESDLVDVNDSGFDDLNDGNKGLIIGIVIAVIIVLVGVGCYVFLS